MGHYTFVKPGDQFRPSAKLENEVRLIMHYLFEKIAQNFNLGLFFYNHTKVER